MNPRFEINADANARQAMLDQLNKNRKTREQAAERPSSSPTPAKTETTEPAQTTRQDEARTRPVHTQLFDELHQALEAVRRQPRHLRQMAAERLAAARRWCDLGEFKQAMSELTKLSSDLTDGFCSVRHANVGV